MTFFLHGPSYVAEDQGIALVPEDNSIHSLFECFFYSAIIIIGENMFLSTRIIFFLCGNLNIHFPYIVNNFMLLILVLS